jgi:hypothetical protein
MTQTGLVPKVYPLLVDAVDVGVRSGIQRAFKHTDTPTHLEIEVAVGQAVMSEICDRFSVVEATDGVDK